MANAIVNLANEFNDEMRVALRRSARWLRIEVR